jgi:hypothetical protein
VARLVEGGAELGEAGVPHQHQEALLGQIARRRGVETGRSVLDGVHPVERHGLTDRQHRFRQRLGRQPLHRIAVNGADFCGLASHPDLINGPAAALKALTKIKARPLFGR